MPTNEELVDDLIAAVADGALSGVSFTAEARAAVLARMVEPKPTAWMFGGTLWTEEMEAEARAVYEGWADQPGYVPWVERGNSDKQTEAGPNRSPGFRWGWVNRRRDYQREDDGHDAVRRAYIAEGRMKATWDRLKAATPPTGSAARAGTTEGE